MKMAAVQHNCLPRCVDPALQNVVQKMRLHVRRQFTKFYRYWWFPQCNFIEWKRKKPGFSHTLLRQYSVTHFIQRQCMAPKTGQKRKRSSSVPRGGSAREARSKHLAFPPREDSGGWSQDRAHRAQPQTHSGCKRVFVVESASRLTISMIIHNNHRWRRRLNPGQASAWVPVGDAY